MNRYLAIIIGFLIMLLITSRLFSAISCYTDLVYSPYLVGRSHAELWTECKQRHLYWPFYFVQ